MNHEKIEVLFEHNAVGLFGDNGVEGVNLVKTVGANRMKNVTACLSTVSSWLSDINRILKSLKNTLIRTKWAISSRKVIVPVQKFPEFLRQEMLPIRIIVRLLRLREVVCKAALEAERYLFCQRTHLIRFISDHRRVLKPL